LACRSYLTGPNPKKVAKQQFDVILPVRFGGLQNQYNTFVAPDFPLALALRGADAMWTTLFTITFVIAISLQLAALSQVD
jgi:hypothetical protein